MFLLVLGGTGEVMHTADDDKCLCYVTELYICEFKVTE